MYSYALACAALTVFVSNNNFLKLRKAANKCEQLKNPAPEKAIKQVPISFSKMGF